MLGSDKDSVEVFTDEVFTDAIGKEIVTLDLNEERLLFNFTDGSAI